MSFKPVMVGIVGQAGPESQIQHDYGCASKFWDPDSANLASTVFVVDRYSLDGNFKTLRTVVEVAFEDALRLLNLCENKFNRLSDDIAHAKDLLSNTMGILDTQTNYGHYLIESQASDDHIEAQNVNLASIQTAIDEMTSGLNALYMENDIVDLSLVTFQKFVGDLGTLNKITTSLESIHNNYGAEYKQSYEAIQKVTVCMKCLDSAWVKMRGGLKELVEGERTMDAVGAYQFPFDDFERFED